MAKSYGTGGIDTQYLEGKLSNYVLSAALPEILADYVSAQTYTLKINEIDTNIQAHDEALVQINNTLTTYQGTLDTHQSIIAALESGGAQAVGDPVNLDNYYPKSETYSQIEVNAALDLKLDVNTYTADQQALNIALQGFSDAIGAKLDASALAPALEPLNTEIGQKVDADTYNTKVGEIEQQLTDFGETLNNQSGVVRRHLKANTVLADADHVYLDSSGGSFTLTVQAASSYHYIRDLSGHLETNPVTVNLPNGDQILMDTNGIELELFKINDVWEAHTK